MPIMTIPPTSSPLAEAGGRHQAANDSGVAAAAAADLVALGASIRVMLDWLGGNANEQHLPAGCWREARRGGRANARM